MEALTLRERERRCRRLFEHDTFNNLPVKVHENFSPFASFSTGNLTLDNMLLECGLGSVNNGGGFPRGSIIELYGPSMSGKTYLLQQIVLSYVKKILISEHHMEELSNSSPHFELSTEQIQTEHNEQKQNFYPHKEIYICLTKFNVVGKSNLGDSVNNLFSKERWVTLFTTELSEENYNAEIIDKVLEHIHFISITHPNDLLSFLSTLSESNENIGSQSCNNDLSELEGNTNDDYKCINNKHISYEGLIVIDSISDIWMHHCLNSPTSLHSKQWYISELVKLLRNCCRFQSCNAKLNNKLKPNPEKCIDKVSSSSKYSTFHYFGSEYGNCVHKRKKLDSTTGNDNCHRIDEWLTIVTENDFNDTRQGFTAFVINSTSSYNPSLYLRFQSNYTYNTDHNLRAEFDQWGSENNSIYNQQQQQHKLQQEGYHSKNKLTKEFCKRYEFPPRPLGIQS